MNITEATHVARLLQLLDGSYSGTNVDQVADSVAYLAPRCEKPLLVTLHLRMDEVTATAGHLIQRQADREVEINLGVERGDRP